MEGTYALPEAQRDRFMMRISMGYPDAASEASCCASASASTRSTRSPVLGAADVRALIAWVRGVHVSPAVEEYAVGCRGRHASTPTCASGRAPRDAAARARREGARGARRPRVRHPGRRRGARRARLRPSTDRLARPHRSRPLGRRTIGAVLRGIVGSVRVPLATR
jgi:MoxR-like ATPase